MVANQLLPHLHGHVPGHYETVYYKRVTRIDNPYDLISPKSNYQWHCYWVFEDIDFRKELTQYNKYIERLKNSENAIDSNEYREKLSNHLTNEKRRICDKYKINSADFLLYATKNNAYPLSSAFGFFTNIIDIKKSMLDSTVEVRFKPNISKTEYVEAWKEIREFIDSEPSYKKIKLIKTRRKEEVDYQLIYAVFKAKSNGMKYPAIFKLYNTGKLPNYKTKPQSRFKNPKELNDYYLRNSTFKG